MGYTVKAYVPAAQRNNIEKEGTFEVTIGNVLFLDDKYVSDDIKEALGNIKIDKMSIIFHDYEDGQKWYDISQVFNKETMGLEYQGWKMDLVSKGVKIPVGTNFDSIQAWADYIKGKSVQIVIEAKTGGNGKTYYNVTDILESGLAF